MKRGYANTRLGQIHFATAGEDKGTPLLLLGQSGRSWQMFKEVTAQLSSDIKIYAPDYPGSGSSDPLPPGTSFEDIAAGFIDFLDDLDLKNAYVYGLHTGAKIGAAMAAGWPARIKRLVIAGQTHSILPDNEKRSGTAGRTRVKLLATTDARESALVHWADIFSVVSGLWWREETVKNLTDKNSRVKTINRAVDELQSAECIPDLYRANFAYDFERDLKRILVPTLIVEIATPTEDRVLGRQGPALLSLVRGAELVTLEEPDYYGITLENRAEELAAILRKFLCR